MRRLVVFNPTARRANRGRRVAEALARGSGAELRETSAPEGAAELARRGREAGVSQLVVAGGDGTVHQAVDGLVSVREGDEARGGTGRPPPPAVGILPLGTGNDLARSLGVPLDLDAARSVVEAGATRTVDLGRVSSAGGRHFVNSAVGGVGGLVERTLSPALKRWLGRLSYLVAVLVSLRHLPRYRVSVECAGREEPLRAEAYSVIVANGRMAGAGIPVAPEARLDDGLLDLVVLEGGSAARVPGLVWDVLRGSHLGRDDVRWLRAERVFVRSRPPMWFSLDGEVFGDEAVEVEVVPRSLDVIVPGSDGSNQEA